MEDIKLAEKYYLIQEEQMGALAKTKPAIEQILDRSMLRYYDINPISAQNP